MTLSGGVEIRRQAAEVLIVIPDEGGEHALQMEAGQGMVEYALILALIALAAVVALGLLGVQVNTFFTQLVTFLQSL